MSRAPVELTVAGQSYQIVSSAPEEELQRLAQVVEAIVRSVTAPGRKASPHSLVLAALTLAHELEVEREKSSALETRYRASLNSLLGRVDHLLDSEALQPEAAEVTVPSGRAGPKSHPSSRE